MKRDTSTSFQRAAKNAIKDINAEVGLSIGGIFRKRNRKSLDPNEKI